MKTATTNSEPVELKGYNLPEFQISFKTKGQPMTERKKVSSSRDIFEFTKQIFNADQIEWVESFVLICLNRRGVPLGFYKVSSGGVAGTVADPKVIFQVALLSNASSIIVAHNHPSGEVSPSQSDIDLTKKLKQAGRLLEIDCLDHLIVSDSKYYSMADEGII